MNDLQYCAGLAKQEKRVAARMPRDALRLLQHPSFHGFAV